MAHKKVEAQKMEENQINDWELKFLGQFAKAGIY